MMINKMVCPQCKGKTKNNQPCKLKTCKFAPKCHHHTSVEIKQSGISGRGLFAKKDIKNNEMLADYNMGSQISEAEFNRRRLTGKATHIALIKGKYLDASNPKKTVAGMVNRGQGGKNNVKLTNTGKIKANKNIKQGKELFMGYGRGYKII
jgi:ribosomal protein L33